MKKIIESLSFKKKLIFIFAVAVLFPFLISNFIFYIYSRNVLENNILDYQQKVASVTMSKAEMAITSLEDIAFYIAGNEQIQENLSNNYEETGRAERYQIYKDVRELLSYYVMISEETVSAYIRTENGSTYNYTKKNQPFPDDSVWNEKVKGGTWIYINGHSYLKREIYRFSDQTKLGDLIVEADTDVFYDIVKDIFSDNESKVFIIDAEDNIIAGQEDTGEKLPEDYLNVIDDVNDTFGRMKSEGNSYFIYASEMLGNGWRFVMAIPESYVMKDAYTLRYFMFFLLVITSAVAVVLLMIAGETITGPITKLSESMDSVRMGDLDTICPVDSRDEIGDLSRNFNSMVKEMGVLVENVYKQEQMKQEAEMKSLQMQINPHFLYNTLDTINWMARLHGADEIGDMTAALGNIMRYALSKNDFVTMDNELANIKDYIDIQNVRYGDRMTIHFDVEENVRECYIPKLLLQPILENAIVHGIEGKLDPGLIEIRIFHTGEDLYIEVEDNGVGMTQDAIESILDLNYSSSGHNGHTSIGVSNVNRRIQAVFGQNCGLSIQSQLGSGTKITLHMKLLYQIPDIQLKYD